MARTPRNFASASLKRSTGERTTTPGVGYEEAVDRPTVGECRACCAPGMLRFTADPFA